MSKPYVTIYCTIYKSKAFAKSTWESIHKYTPHFSDGRAVFKFVANDPPYEFEHWLREQGYYYIYHKAEPKTEEELFALGYGSPSYLYGVYASYNRSIEVAKTDLVLLTMSDCQYSPGWLDSLLEISTDKRCVASQLIERDHPVFGLYPGALRGEFGDHPSNFKHEKFLDMVERVRRPGFKEQTSAHNPAIYRKSWYEKVGGFPTGNIAGATYKEVVKAGDAAYIEKLATIGVRHVTAFDSVVYHYKEGEKNEPEE